MLEETATKLRDLPTVIAAHTITFHNEVSSKVMEYVSTHITEVNLTL